MIADSDIITEPESLACGHWLVAALRLMDHDNFTVMIVIALSDYMIADK
jgi:hypothetical protein